jgi:hypothetical protein
MREKLSPRRLGITERLTFRPGTLDEITFDATYGFEPGGPVKECFTLAFKVGSGIQDMMHQACTGLSIALQSGQSMSDLARIMGEDHPEFPPHSPVGLVVRAGVMLDDYLTAQWALIKHAPPRAPNVFGHVFDTSDYIVIDEGMRREAASGRLVPIVNRKPLTASQVGILEDMPSLDDLFEGECAPDMHPVDLGDIPDFLRRDPSAPVAP